VTSGDVANVVPEIEIDLGSNFCFQKLFLSQGWLQHRLRAQHSSKAANLVFFTDLFSKRDVALLRFKI